MKKLFMSLVVVLCFAATSGWATIWDSAESIPIPYDCIDWAFDMVEFREMDESEPDGFGAFHVIMHAV